MDSEKGNRVFARGHNVPPLVFGAQKKSGLDRVKVSPSCFRSLEKLTSNK